MHSIILIQNDHAFRVIAPDRLERLNTITTTLNNHQGPAETNMRNAIEEFQAIINAVQEHMPQIPPNIPINRWADLLELDQNVTGINFYWARIDHALMTNIEADEENEGALDELENAINQHFPRSRLGR